MRFHGQGPQETRRVIALPSPRRAWYGWWILGIVFGATASLFAARYAFGIFFKPLTEEFGWSRAETSGAFSVAMLAQAACAPLLGAALDRWGARRVMMGGVLACGIALCQAVFIRHLAHLYATYFLFSIGFTAATLIAQVRLISDWFHVRRGLAMGFSNASQGLASILMAGLAGLMLFLGWRGGYALLAALVLLFAWPACGLLLRDRPEEMGTSADAPFAGAAFAAKARAASAAAEAGRPLRALAVPFALICGLYGVVAYNVNALLVHLVPLATDLGHSALAASGLFGLWGVALLAGNLISGFSDRLGRVAAYLAGTAMGAASSVLLGAAASSPTLVQLGEGVLLSGLGLGIMRPTVLSLISESIPERSFGVVNGMIITVVSFVGAAGPFVTGRIYDAFGGYGYGFLIMGGLYLAGGALALVYRGVTRPAGQVRSSLFSPYKKAA